MKPLKGILFDFNGTLFFDSFYQITAFQQLAPLYGKSFTAEEIVGRMFGRSTDRIFCGNYKEDATPDDIKLFFERRDSLYFDICLSHPEALRLTLGAEELLEYLKESGIPYAMATGAQRNELEFFFEHLPLGRYFTWDNILYTDGTFRGKPAPDGYLLAAKKLGLDASECLIFEDGTAGLAAARAANAGGLMCIYEKGLPSPETDSVRADEVHHDLKQWREILTKYGF